MPIALNTESRRYLTQEETKVDRRFLTPEDTRVDRDAPVSQAQTLTPKERMLQMLNTKVEPGPEYFVSFTNTVRELMAAKPEILDELLIEVNYNEMQPVVGAFFVSRLRRVGRLVNWYKAKDLLIQALTTKNLNPQEIAPDIF